MKDFIVIDWAGNIADEFDKEEDAVVYAKEIALEDSDDAHVYKFVATARLNLNTGVQVHEGNRPPATGPF